MTGARTSISPHGETARETQIMDLFEAGAKPPQIADELGLSTFYVRSVIYNLNDSGRDPLRLNAKTGSDALLRALRKHFPERCGASSSNSRSRPLAPAGAARDIPPRAAPTPYAIGGKG